MSENKDTIKDLQKYVGKKIKSIELCEQNDHKPEPDWKYSAVGVKITFTDDTFIHLYDGEQYGMGIITEEKDLSIDTGGDWKA